MKDEAFRFECDSLVGWAVVQLVGVVVWAGWRVEREVGCGNGTGR